MKLTILPLLLLSTASFAGEANLPPEVVARAAPPAPPTVTLTQAELQSLVQAEAAKAVTAYISQQEAAKAASVYAKVNAAFVPSGGAK